MSRQSSGGQAATEPFVLHVVQVNGAGLSVVATVPRMAFRTSGCALFAVLVLVGCGAAPQPLPPPGASGTVAVHVWDPQGGPPTVLVAERIRQEGMRFDRLLLDRVRGRLVQPDLDCAMNAPSGVWSARQGLLGLDGPVRLAGTWQGSPMLGTAAAASLSRDGGALVLQDVELWHRGQRLTAAQAELRRDRTLIAPHGMATAPLPAELAAILAALPDPLPLPH